MKQPGFMLLELLIALVISSLIGVALFNSLNVTNRTVGTVDDLVDYSKRVTVIKHQMEKDILGAMIPIEGLKKKPDKKQQAAGEPASNQPQAAQLPEVVKKETEQKEKEQTKPKKINKVFYGTQKDGMFNVLSFITNNPLKTYWSGTVGKAKPYVARVVYRLVPEQKASKDKPSYVLTRQEGSKLNFEAYNTDAQEPIRAYEVASGIKKLTIRYTAEISKETVEKKGKEETKTVETEYKVMNEWNLDDEKKQNEQEQLKTIPYAVDVDLVLWDTKKQKQKTYTFKTVILAEQVEFEAEQAQAPAPVQPQKTPEVPKLPVPGAPKIANNKKSQNPSDKTFQALRSMLAQQGHKPGAAT